MADPNDFRPGDLEYDLLRKLLNRTGAAGGGTTVNIDNSQFTQLDNSLSSIDASNTAIENNTSAIETNTSNIETNTSTTNTTLTTISGKLDVQLSTVGQQRGSLTDGSGTIATGGASQQIFAANTARKYLIIQNLSSESLWINFGTAAVADQPSLELPGTVKSSFVMEGMFVSTQTVNIIGATTGSKFVAKQG
jgi:hypothetical protein